MRPIWKNHWLLFRSTHSQKSPEKRDFVVHTQKATAGLLFFYMRTKASRHIAPKSNSSAVVFLCRQGLCNYVAPRIAWRTPAHQADACLFLQDNLHDSLLRKPLGFLRVPEDAPSVMVYKSFLIDHHFCIFRGIFTPF